MYTKDIHEWFNIADDIKALSELALWALHTINRTDSMDIDSISGIASKLNAFECQDSGW